MMSSAAAGMPAKPQPHRLEPFVHHAADGQLGHLAMLHDHPVEHLGVFAAPGASATAEATGAPSSVKATAPPATSWPSSASSSPLRPLLTAPTGIDVGLPCPLRLEHDELGGRLGVDGRDGVGHAGDRGHAAGQGGARAGGDRLVFFVARLAQMDMNVDQARADDHALGVDDDLGFLVAPAQRQDPAPADPEVADLVDVLPGVDDPAAR